MSLDALAGSCSLDADDLGAIKRGERQADMTVYERLAPPLDVSVEDLLPALEAA